MYERRLRESTQPGMNQRRECKMTKIVYRKTCDQILYALLSPIPFDLKKKVIPCSILISYKSHNRISCQLSFMNGPFYFCFLDLRTSHLLAVLLRDDPLEFKVMLHGTIRNDDF